MLPHNKTIVNHVKKFSVLWYVGGGLFLLLIALSFVVNQYLSSAYNRTLGINAVVFGKEDTYLYAVRPKLQTIYVMKLPRNLMIKTFDTGAEYPIVSILELAKRNHESNEFVTRSISESLGINVPMYFAGRSLGDEVEWASELGKLMVKSDLGWMDRLALRGDIHVAIKSGKVVNYDVKPNLFEKTVEPDGSEVLRVNFVFAEYVKSRFTYDELFNEPVEMTVYNTSSNQGVGLSLSRILESSGLRVVEVDKKEIPETHVNGYCAYATNVELSEIMKWYLNKYVDCKQTGTESITLKNPKEVQLFRL